MDLNATESLAAVGIVNVLSMLIWVLGQPELLFHPIVSPSM
jgi:hypothetical protein